MAKIRCLVLLMISSFFITAVVVVGAATHQITWQVGFDCATWASNQTFTIGDKLLFFSNNANNVMNVSHIDYINCNPSSPYATYQTGNNLVTIGRRDLYFISSIREDCRSGLKLHVHVNALPLSSSVVNALPPSSSVVNALPPSSVASNHRIFSSVMYTTSLILYVLCLS